MTGVWAKRGLVLYVSSRSDWVLPCPVNFETPENAEWTVHVMQYLKYLSSAALFKYAVPRMGDHCSEEWCPYRNICKNKTIPPPGTMHGLNTAAPTMNFTGLIA